MKTSNRARRLLLLGAGLLPLALASSDHRVRAADDAATAAEPAQSIRLSPSQYKQSIADIFGGHIAIAGRFEPEERTEGLLAIGARQVSVSSTGVERYDDLARGVAAQVVDKDHRDTLLPCKPKAENAADEACARDFITAIGELMYRRPMSSAEVESKVKASSEAANTLHNFYAGQAAILSDMLISPKFLFRYRVLEPDPNHPGQQRLDAYSKASALSFFLWNSTPDKMLLKAAETGEINTKEGLKRQVDRMVSSPRVEGAVRAFFADMLGFSEFETVAKDPQFFPRYTLTVKDQSQEQTLRTVVDHLIARQGDYRDLFTTPHTFLTSSLAPIYGVPLIDKTDNGQPEHWMPYSFQPGDPRAGILAQASFVALHSPAGRTSPTGRGKALRENILCQAVPPPPGNVDFKFVQDTSNPVYKTTRDRLTAHRSEAMCAGCHKITDPIGLALENFDSAGGYRTTENGVQIDTSGELSGVKFDGPAGLAKVLHDDPAVTSCVAKKAFAFGAGQLPAANDAEWVGIQKKFTDSHYNFVELLRQIALSDLLYKLPPSKVAAAAGQSVQ